MVQLPPPPQHPSAAQPNRAAELQYQAVTKFWKAVLGIVLSIAAMLVGWAAHQPIVLGVGILGLALAAWTLHDAVQLNNAAESGQPVVDYPESPEEPQRVSDLQQLFRDAEHRALRAPDNELPTRPRSAGGVAGTEGFD
jgi:hypothetical protein